MNKLDLTGKIAIVTGAGNGLGKCTALTFAEIGARVMVSDINEESAFEVKEEIERKGYPVEAIRTDVTREEDIRLMVEKTIDRFGRVDILVNCAGVSNNKPLIETTEAEWNRIFNINVKGVFLATRAILPHMIKQQSGKIVNFSSMVGKEAYANNVPYSASKFAVLGMTQGVAKEVAKHNINVNAVCPGVIMTELMDREAENMAKLEGISKDKVIQRFCEEIPLNRLQTPEDVAGVVAFLCSDLAKNMTGQGINVTGGLMLH
ncbi:SDR family NAD(P)-dependent oxidoreductase [Bacillus sp. B15-48]|uniref:SDR family NAD(P)-dependent oxidoreductase n=1 Tax=Bacillus sp. B15-48 TaxID=1548601 RepID=UPI00193FD675|nr:SDR family NAD(P)-dependent oxidoreductase [Bacillus sp. B15-48]MBM4764991.1 glucose 1-dehydrogenase [Bacillus sp. B15-48]